MNNFFSQTNKLKSYYVEIDGQKLVGELIVSYEAKYNINSTRIFGSIILNDIGDFTNYFDLVNNKLTFLYVDLFDEVFKRNFYVINVDEIYNDFGDKNITLKIQDEVSYKLERSFLSKGFKTNPVDAFKKYIDELKIEIETNFEDFTYNYDFVVPKTISNLDFFETELKKNGYFIFQDKTKINIIKYSNLLKDNVKKDTYSNEVENKLYKNIIIELKSSYIKKDDMKPLTRSIFYDTKTKSIIYKNDNSNESFMLNGKSQNLQDTNGYKDVCLQHDYDEHYINVMENHFNSTLVSMIVNGYCKNDINQIYPLRLKGSRGTSDSQTNGNKIVSGNYLCCSITDKLVGDSMIQKIDLRRSDLQK